MKEKKKWRVDPSRPIPRILYQGTPTTKQVETKALKDQWVNIYPSHPYTIRNQLQVNSEKVFQGCCEGQKVLLQGKQMDSTI